ncbi:hybrid sensor histidine kinase/response regulator [Xenophilus arseniciresistens]|uniref:histidine kinase n=1 Tax=Xenophilus arseniciresistens TaxID=1283306 RepID=A0AAE3T2T1_9BURK|nr:hybrid sensor histidine kinase/response regulator [Xenophilus arseniciresistens]MDA7418747.1 hybrid sensor histidine kinase/response regulator [Xenophilus arseniciresistens]
MGDPAVTTPPPSSAPQGRRHPLRRLSLAQQLVLLAVLPAVLAMLGTVGVLTRQYLDGVSELVRASARAVALQLATTARHPLADMDRRALLRLAQSGLQQPHVQQVQLWSEDGEILANAETMDQRRADGVQVQIPVRDDTGRPLGQVMVEMSLDAVQHARRTVWVNVLLVLGASLLSVVLAGTWAARRISAPIRRLARAVDRLAAGERVQVPVEGAAEVQRLQAGFNAAVQALSESQRLLQSRVDAATAELAHKNQQLEVASQAKTRLLAAASHDLRQPLHALTLFSDGLANGETDPAKLTRIGHIRECVDSLDRLFSELLNLSQLDAGVLQPQWTEFPLDQLLDELSRNFRPVAEEQELRLVVRKTDIWVRSDYVMLSRILSNLVSNSLRHTPEGGVLVGARRRGRQVLIEVWDTGVGIEPQHQDRVFEEFFQVDNPRLPPCPSTAPAPTGRAGRGMGLGLATVQRLAALLNTRVELRSRPGRGTCVRVGARIVPALAAPPSIAAPLMADTAPRLDGLRMLVIDDERTILEGLQAVLGSWGAEVWAAQSRDEALALAARWPQPPDVVLSDLLLQGGDNGLDVLAALERLPNGIGPGTARLLVTGETKPDRLREVAAAGIAVLYKPVSPATLRQAILAQLQA